MQPHPHLIPIFFSLLLLPSCVPTTPSEETGIRKAVVYVYSKPFPYETIGGDSILFSRELAGLMQRAKEVESSDAERVMRSDAPTDKPLLIEGEIFASLYEGYTSFEVKDVQFSGDSARVVVDFTNKNYKEQWADTVILLKQGAWKVDDVRYADKYEPGLKVLLGGFVAKGK
jgi:hypothetical protein